MKLHKECHLPLKPDHTQQTEIAIKTTNRISTPLSRSTLSTYFPSISSNNASIIDFGQLLVEAFRCRRQIELDSLAERGGGRVGLRGRLKTASRGRQY